MKAIRDKTPTKQGTAYGRLTGDAYIELLLTKLHEESDEVKEGWEQGDIENYLEELGDLLEIIRELAVRVGRTFEHVRNKQADKLIAKGGFTQGRVKV